MHKYSICVDLDGVIHQYVSPWTGVLDLHDPPIPGAFEWLTEMVEHFNIIIHTARLNGGKWVDHGEGGPAPTATAEQVTDALRAWFMYYGLAAEVLDKFQYWTHAGKPAALVYLDDRAVRFDGSFPSREDIHLKLRPEKHGARQPKKLFCLEVERPGDYDDHYQRPRDAYGIFSSEKLATEYWDALPRETRLLGGETVEGRLINEEWHCGYGVYPIPLDPKVGG